MSPFESPSKAEHPSRKRSVFARSGSGRKAFALGVKKKAAMPPSSGGSKSSKMSSFLFRSPSSMGSKPVFHRLVQPESQAAVPVVVATKPLFHDASSVTSFETTPSTANDSNAALTKSSTSKPLSNQLRAQLQDLGANNKRCDLLLGQVKVLEAESQRKDEKLRTLNDRLHGIQRGLSQIDEERTSLLEQVKQLEEEKRTIYDQLVLREKECLTLVKRCSTQEERMKESALLRVRNTALEKEMKELSSTKKDQEQQARALEATKLQLKECQHKLEHTKRDHDALANTLRNCLANIKKLTHDKQEWEDERRRLLNRAEMEIEKERLQHVEAINELRVSLQSRQDKVDKLEEFMKDKSMTNLMLRKENAALNKWKTQTSVKLDECERQIAELSDENREIHEEAGDSAVNWSARLKEKESIIEALKEDISTFMTRAMTASETVELMEEENLGRYCSTMAH